MRECERFPWRAAGLSRRSARSLFGNLSALQKLSRRTREEIPDRYPLTADHQSMGTRTTGTERSEAAEVSGTSAQHFSVIE